MDQLRLLHISDIHYAGYEGAWDYDHDLRAELLLDLERLLDGESLDGVLVGGDVTFRASTDEYLDASSWLKEVCDVGGCRHSSVWTVPGNHDIDWRRVEASAIVEEFHDALRLCEIGDIDGQLRRRLHDDENGDVLLGPLENYNTFALPFGCPSTRKQLAWTDVDNLSLGRYPIHLIGVNSALISDRKDPREVAEAMVLGRAQCQIERVANSIRIVLCHHPPGWVRDWDAVGPYLRSRAHVIFYGHEHTFAAKQEGSGVVEVFAGAVHPEREEVWVPSYNVVELHLDADTLGVRVLAREWDPDATRFSAGDSESYEFTIPMQPVAEGNGTGVDEDVSGDGDSTVEESEESPGTSEHKDLFYRFLDLPRTTRLTIAAKLDLLGAEDRDLPDHELFPQLLRRAEEQNLIDQLAKEVLGVSRS
jgi:predicted phosphodiesterase